MAWKYAQVKVLEVHRAGTPSEDECEIFELYDLDDAGEFMSFCSSHFACLKDLKMAIEDIERDGTNTWFYDNGVFEYIGGEWEWEKREKETSFTINEYGDDNWATPPRDEK